MSKPNRRNKIDASLQVVKAFPAASGNNTTDVIDLGANYDRLPESAQLKLDIPAADLADTKTLTFSLEASADNSTWAATGVTFVATGSGSDGYVDEENIPLPVGVGRYLRVKTTAVASSGDVTGSNLTVSVVA